ncbi:hypothetical protein [Pedosphaera parvula]|uniref:Uncharacterized protein n=1 Tax=Pedosphaera parvula (strain Ellin514) TaxID=320771 RepID=B9XEE1_PEDPL|nr:hypothetical protein [Pedosphaera parvula]EEF61655.1 hypothetical protein Cflav_PD4695 [Pedosphaera parvula Ellin514]
MTKRKKFSFILIAVLVFATGAFLYFRATERPIKINGKLSPEDVAAIKSVVNREIWRSAFPDFSFKTFKNLPGAIKTSWSLRIVSIDSLNGLTDPGWLAKTASANVIFGKSERGGIYTYACTKSSNQWVFVMRVGPKREIDSYLF